MTDAIITGDRLECPPTEHEQDYFLRIYNTVYPFEYLRPMKVNPSAGYEQFQSYAALGERISLAVKHFLCGQYAMYADGPAFATGTVAFFRTDTASDVMLEIGSTVSTGDGRVYVTTAQTEFLSGNTLPELLLTPVRAIAAGYDYNRRGQRTTARGETLAGEVSLCINIIQTPPYTDPTIQVRQPNDIEGGVCDALACLAYDRGVYRGEDEPDSALRLRTRTLPDTVTPNAIRRQLAQYLDPRGVGWAFVEPWALSYQTCWDAPSSNAGTPSYQPVPPTNLLYNENLFWYDEPTNQDRFRNYWLAREDARAAFIIFLQMPPEVSPGVFLYPSFTSQAQQDAYMRGLVQLIEQIKAGGVHVAYKVYR